MLTRLKVNGFKNLVDVDVRFGPFTCVAGANGVGKSNLFDAIHFLSALADQPLIDAARSVREGRRTADIRSLFHRTGSDYDTEMSFEAEMIIPKTGYDDAGQKAEASITFLKYSLTLEYRADGNRLEIRNEQLVHITLGDAPKHLLFPHNTQWRHSAVSGRRTAAAFISTELEKEGSDRGIKLHQDSGGGGGRPLTRKAADLPRTVLSTANAAEHKTAVLVRREMQSWRLLQLEPSALREPDDFTAQPHLGTNGAHLAATLYNLAKNKTEELGLVDEAQVYGRIANRLAELLDDVRDVSVDRDERRELLTLQVTDRDNTVHSARSLSDGTLRFLALAVLELDPDSQGVLCLEEPENGIHPKRIPNILKLLGDIAVDTHQPVGLDNPLRQVIINTHSPSVVKQIPHDSLLVARAENTMTASGNYSRVRFCCLPDTWRTKASEKQDVVSLGDLLSYLNPDAEEFVPKETNGNAPKQKAKSGRVMDHPDIQPLLPGISL